jgi:hypothetical protein
MRFDRGLLRAAFVLFGLSMGTGLLIPLFKSPRLGLAAHLTGLLNVFVLTALAAAVSKFPRHERPHLLRLVFLFCAFTMWFGGVLGASWGTTWVTPMASAPLVNTAAQAALWQQLLILVLTLVTVFLYIIAASVVVWRLRALHAD